MEPFKILFLLSHLKNSATYVRAYHLARQLADRGHKVTLTAVSPEQKFGASFTVENGLTLIETANLGHEPLGRMTLRLYLEPGAGPCDILTRLRLLRSDKFDIVHMFDHSPNVAVPFYLMRSRIRARFVSDWCDIYHCPGGLRDHNSFRLDRLYRLVGFPFRIYSRFVEHDLRRRVHGVTAISEGLRRYAMRHGIPQERVQVVEGGADVRHIRPLSRTAARLRLGLAGQGKVVGFLGTFQRDLDIVIGSFSLVRLAVPGARLMVIGKLHESTRQQVAQAGLSDCFIEAGRCSDELLPWFLAAADVFVLPLKDIPANATRWPNKIGEYMASGRPTVVNDVGDVANLVREYGIGLLAGQGAAPFADKITKLLTNEFLAEELGKKAREVACTRYSWASLAEGLEQFYLQLLKRDPYDRRFTS